MKKNMLPALLASLCTLAGVLCMAIRRWLLTAATDSAGLLQSGHPGNWISWAITAAVLVTLVAAVLPAKLRCSFQRSPLTVLGNVMEAVALGIVAGQLLGAVGTFSLVAGIAAILAALCCCVQAVCTLFSRRFPPLLRCPAVLFMLLYLICCYQSWSSEPELQRYGFALLALTCLALTAYQRVALPLKLGSSRIYLFTANAGIFLCLAAAPGAKSPLFFLLMAVACLLDGYDTAPVREA